MSKLPHHILVADSDYAFARLLRLDLEARGFVVEVVSDGLSAINVVMTRPLNGAVVDVDLVTVDGLHVLELIKDFKRGLPVIVTGKRDRPGIERRVHEAGGEAYVVKPCEPARLAEALRQSMSGGVTAPRQRPSLTLTSLEAGQVLLLECPGGQVQGRLSSKLVAKHPASLAVAAPRRDGDPVALPFGVPMTVGFPMPDGWYYFDTHVLGAVSYSGEPAILLAQPKLLNHIQRRRYARSRGPFAVDLESDAGTVTAKGHDIGEGGMLISASRPLAVGARFGCHIAAGGPAEPMSLTGVVVWTHERRDNGPQFRAGIEFSRLPAAERRRLRTRMAALVRPPSAAAPDDHGATNTEDRRSAASRG